MYKMLKRPLTVFAIASVPTIFFLVTPHGGGAHAGMTYNPHMPAIPVVKPKPTRQPTRVVPPPAPVKAPYYRLRPERPHETVTVIKTPRR
jgi:hypothetical protein